jgi:hypothetical protein
MKRFLAARRNVVCIIARILVSYTLVGGASANAQSAQATSTLRQLDGRASALLRAEVTSLADSVARAGLPVAPLVDKTLEGVSKGADDRRIMIAVRAVASELRVARQALGPSSESELSAGVAALRAGSSAGELTQLRQALPGRPLVVPLSVLASLLVDGAPPPSALVAVVSNAKQRNDADLLAYGQVVSQDIANGIAPLTAISAPRTAAMSTTLSTLIRTPAVAAHPSPKPKP